MKLLALDPGGTTGWALIDIDETVVTDLSCGQIGDSKHHRILWDFLHAEDPDRLICEMFTYQIRRNQGVDMPGVELISREYIGVAELYTQTTPCVLEMQPTSCLSFWSDDKLKIIGLYRPGKPHANDAVRHLLYFITFTMKDYRYLHQLKRT